MFLLHCWQVQPTVIISSLTCNFLTFCSAVNFIIKQIMKFAFVCPVTVLPREYNDSVQFVSVPWAVHRTAEISHWWVRNLSHKASVIFPDNDFAVCIVAVQLYQWSLVLCLSQTDSIVAVELYQWSLVLCLSQTDSIVAVQLYQWSLVLCLSQTDSIVAVELYQWSLVLCIIPHPPWPRLISDVGLELEGTLINCSLL